ncbi:MAG: hypothetical protein JXA67_02910 [Micromonosporaceae bacterium]|nr:hypothetical protein [Micromonosporaceae bacterium]
MDPQHPDPIRFAQAEAGLSKDRPNHPAAPEGQRCVLWGIPPTEQPGCLPQPLARWLLEAYTQDGDVIVDIDDDMTCAGVAAAMGRRHHALGGEQHLAAMSHAAGGVDLVLLHWPRAAVNPNWLLRACRSLLGDGGRVVIAVMVDADARVAHLSALTGAASTAGLAPVRHVVVASQLAATPAAVMASHADLLVFERAVADDG